MGKKRKVKNCTCQQVDKAKNTADKQYSPRLWPLLTALICKEREKKFLFTVRGPPTEASKALRFFSEGIVIWTYDVFFSTIDAKAYKKIKTLISHVWKYCKDLSFAYLLFMATWTNQTRQSN